MTILRQFRAVLRQFQGYFRAILGMSFFHARGVFWVNACMCGDSFSVSKGTDHANDKWGVTIHATEI